MSISVIIKDSMGEILTMLSELKNYIIAFDFAEATVVLRTAKFCNELRFFKVILECDTF